VENQSKGYQGLKIDGMGQRSGKGSSFVVGNNGDDVLQGDTSHVLKNIHERDDQ
jgi:hypothetical protein